jgi:anti-anti-sigma factor
MGDSLRFQVPPLTMTTEWPRPDTCLVTLAGELDMDTAPLLADYLREQTSSGPAHLLLDLAGVELIAAAGVNLIVGTLRNEHGIRGQLRIIGLPANKVVARTLRLTGVDALLPVHPTADDALEHLDRVNRN